MSLEADMQTFTADLVAEYGKAVTLQRTTSEYDPGTGGTVNTTTDYPAMAAPPKDFTTAWIDGTLIQQGDTVLDLPALGLGVAPRQGDAVVLDGQTWNVVQAGRVYGGSEVALYRLQLRK